MKNRILATLITTLAVGLAQRGAAVDFHVTTAQELQNALTLAAANGADDNIYLAAAITPAISISTTPRTATRSCKARPVTARSSRK